MKFLHIPVAQAFHYEIYRQINSDSQKWKLSPPVLAVTNGIWQKNSSPCTYVYLLFKFCNTSPHVPQSGGKGKLKMLDVGLDWCVVRGVGIWREHH